MKKIVYAMTITCDVCGFSDTLHGDTYRRLTHFATILGWKLSKGWSILDDKCPKCVDQEKSENI